MALRKLDVRPHHLVTIRRHVHSKANRERLHGADRLSEAVDRVHGVLRDHPVQMVRVRAADLRWLLAAAERLLDMGEWTR